jgi:hypothetical protein
MRKPTVCKMFDLRYWVLILYRGVYEIAFLSYIRVKSVTSEQVTIVRCNNTYMYLSETKELHAISLPNLIRVTVKLSL